MSADEEGINRRQFYYEVIHITDRVLLLLLVAVAPAGMEYLRAATRQDPAAAAAQLERALTAGVCDDNVVRVDMCRG